MDIQKPQQKHNINRGRRAVGDEKGVRDKGIIS
jgi:hypothetical protein